MNDHAAPHPEQGLNSSPHRKFGLLNLRDWTTWVLLAVPIAVVAGAYTWISVPLADAKKSLGNSTEVGNQALAENAELKAQISRINDELSKAPPAPRFATCRDPSHGVERYAHTEPLTRESGWRGGGFSQPGWCNQLTSMLKGDHPGSVLKVKSSSEQSRSTCPPFNCPQYNYTCTIEVLSDPIFVERESAACTETPDRALR